MRKTLFILLAFAFIGCKKDGGGQRTTTTFYAGKYVGDVILSTGSTSTSYNMVIDLSTRTNSNEYNFLFGNRQSVVIVSGSNFTIPRVQGAPSFMVSGNGSFLNDGKISLDYTEEVQGGYQNFKGVVKKF